MRTGIRTFVAIVVSRLPIVALNVRALLMTPAESAPLAGASMPTVILFPALGLHAQRRSV